MIQVLSIENLLEKEFSLVKRQDGDFYSRTFSDTPTVQRLCILVGEDVGQFDYDFTGIHCTLEIKSDFSSPQYMFIDRSVDGTWFVPGHLTVEEFEKLINEVV